MMNVENLLGSRISDADVAWGCDAMGLPSHAFSGQDNSDPRAALLKRLDSVDVEACPGSGKTTLLVTKLAILAKKWQPLRAGVCVLSHTNVARNEIEERLGPFPEGSALLHYPHFVGTIHSFINEFIALPWLKSQGIEVRAVDTEIALDRRWTAVPFGTRNYLNQKFRDKYCLTYSSHDFSQGGMSDFPSHTETYKKIVEICKKSYQDGYFCYDEMFVWANHALDQCPTIAASLRERFPLVFIDEVQDNSELQSCLLHRVLFAGEHPSVRQRFGDSNQAIFQHNEQSAVTDVFPVSPHVDLPNSHRFGAAIATLASPLGVRPHALTGCGPRKSPALGSPINTIFLFDEGSVRSVLSSFAQHLLVSFTPDEIGRAHFSAVAAVHNKDEEDKIPRSLKHYAPDYDPTIANTDCKPATLLQYVRSAHGQTIETSNTFQLVRGFANGVVRLTIMLPGSTAKATLSQFAHRSIEKYLSEHPDRLKDYRSSLRTLVDCAGLPTQALWESDICPSVRRVVATLAGLDSLNAMTEKFLSWTPFGFVESPAGLTRRRDNVFSYPESDPVVRIHLGSIHSVKGETHTATLVLDTFFKKHHLSELKPWLIGTKSGGASGSALLQSRLRLHYVAMTRPANLLCLAMRNDALSDNDRISLGQRGWRLVQCVAVSNSPTLSTEEGELSHH
jgi:DNA helicase II / ATP-dependent DNA helicase PcrA